MSQDHEKIQRYIIKSTPYGQLTDVLKDLDKISAIDLTSPALTQTIEQYNQQHLAIISTPDGNLLVMPGNKSREASYVDQLRRKTYTVDHLKLESVDAQDVELDLMEEVLDLQKHLQEQTNAYCNKYYRTPNGSQVFVEVNEETGLSVHVGLTSKNVTNLANFYTGEWVSKWRITKDEIEGVVSVRAHFFEGGNVQFNQKKQLKQEFKFTPDMKENSRIIISIIEKFQSQFQQSLNTIYDEMPNKYFKQLRRITAFTKTKMTWNINAVKMNHNLLGK